MLAGISGGAVNFGLPNDFPIRAVETEDGLVLLRAVAGGEVNAIAHHRRRAVSTAGQGSFPQNVFGLAPLHWWILSRRGDAVAGWPTPRGPIGGRNGNSGRRPEARAAEMSAEARGKNGSAIHNGRAGASP